VKRFGSPASSKHQLVFLLHWYRTLGVPAGDQFLFVTEQFTVGRLCRVPFSQRVSRPKVITIVIKFAIPPVESSFRKLGAEDTRMAEWLVWQNRVRSRSTRAMVACERKAGTEN